jgi:Mpv17 / PMP22 family
MMNVPANVQFVPLNYRLLLVNTIALGWNCTQSLLFELIATGYLSVVNAPSQIEQEKKDKLTILVE